jgi:aspartate/methionine/tyrosine aminotransferase
MVYPLESLKKIIQIAKEYKIFVISDEIYNKIVYNGVRSYALAEYVEDVPGIAMKGLSKEMPWPGSRCGWLEFYNKDKDSEFAAFSSALDNAKMIEVCSTTLPQLALPLILGDSRYETHRANLNEQIGRRSALINKMLSEVPELTFNPTYGAFYNSIIFKDGTLNSRQILPIENPKIRAKVEEWCEGVSPDYRFVYYLLGATGICVVPTSSFCSELQGFRVTILEEDEEELIKVFTSLRDAIRDYVK